MRTEPLQPPCHAGCVRKSNDSQMHCRRCRARRRARRVRRDCVRTSSGAAARSSKPSPFPRRRYLKVAVRRVKTADTPAPLRRTSHATVTRDCVTPSREHARSFVTRSIFQHSEEYVL